LNPAVVTHIASNDNPGVNGIGQYRLFQVAANTGTVTANIPISLQWTNAAQTPYISNLWVVAPGDFTVPGSNVTNWTFDRTQPYALSSEFLTRLANGCGSMRWVDSTLGYANYCNMTEPWEEPQLTDFSWSCARFQASPYPNIAYSSARPFDPAVSPYIYQAFVGTQQGSTWTCSSNLSAAIIDTVSTSITISSANTDPIFSGVIIEIDSEQMYVRALTNTSTGALTVIRGFAGTVAATHLVNAPVTILSKRWAWGSLTNITGVNAQLVEFVTTAPHGLKGPVQFGLGGSFPTFTFTDSSTANFSGLNIWPWVTGPSTFMAVTQGGANSNTPVTLSTTQSLAGSTASNWNPSASNGYPMEFIAMVTGSLPGTHLHVNIPLAATDAYVWDVAVKIRDNFPSGRRVYLELADEPWNSDFDEYGMSLWLSTLAGNGNPYYFYVIRTGEIRTIFRTVFGSRANEVYAIANNQWVSTGSGSSMLGLAATYGVTIDADAVAPYIILDDSVATIAAWNNSSTIQQMVDLFIHDTYYNNNGWNSWVAGHQVLLATYNVTARTNTNGPAFLYGYEGDYAEIPPGIANQFTLSHDVPLDPNWRIIQQDLFALYQRSGFVNLNIYSYAIYYGGGSIGIENWGVYHYPSQQPGSSTNNRLWFATPRFRVNYDGTPTNNQDAHTVSVRGQALLDWMGNIAPAIIYPAAMMLGL